MPDHPLPPPRVAIATLRTVHPRILAGLTILVLFIANGLAVLWVAARPSPIHIAFANTLSGAVEPVGAEILKAAGLYVDEVNRSGGVDGHPIVLDRFDDLGTPDGARANVQAIADGPALAVFGHLLSPTSLAAGPGYRAAHIPALSSQALADALTVDNPFYFRAQTPNSQQAQWLAYYIQDVLLGGCGQLPGNTRLDLVTSNDAYGLSYAGGFVPVLGGRSPKTWTLNVDPKALAASAQATADALAREPEPRIIVIGVSLDSSPALVKAIRRRGIHAMLVLSVAGGDGYLANFADEPEERITPGFFTSNLYTTASVIFDTVGSPGQQFAESYTAATGKPPSQVSDGANDAMRIMTEALRRAHPANTAQSKARDREKIRDALASIDSPEHGVLGLDGPLYFNPNRDMPRSLRFGSFDRGRLVSAPIQIVAVQNPALIDLGKEIAAGRIVTIGDRFFWLQRVVYAGINIAHLGGIDIKARTFNADVYVWLRYGGDDDAPTHICSGAQSKCG